MGSPLGPILANIFVGFHEEQLFAKTKTPLYYARYVDDTFAVFTDENHRAMFHHELNQLHNCLEFTGELESNGTIPFLDVTVHKRQGFFLTQVYRKPTFTGQYTRWTSFCDTKRKTNLVRTLTHRALMLCSDEFLEVELNTIRSIFQANGYPMTFVRRTMERKIEHFHQVLPSAKTPSKCPVYLRLPYIGKISDCYRGKITETITRCYFAVNPRVIFTSRPMIPSSTKDTLPSHQRSNLIYLFKCSCDSTYVGRTNQRLSDRIRQHVPRKVQSILGSNMKTKDLPPSAIANHLLQNPECGRKFKSEMFTIITHGRTFFHLQALEALNISVRKPPLCQQKKFVHTMLLFKHLGSGM